MKKRMAAQFTLRFDDEYPDTVSVCEWDDDTDFEDGDWYEVIQHGIWWWKSFAIAYYIADTSAGGINSGGWWKDVKSGFKTKTEAMAVLRAGGFPVRY